MLRFARAWRWALAIILATQGTLIVLDLFLWHRALLALLPLVMGCALVGASCLHARTIATLEKRNRPRPDYALIAEIEREVYGEAFHHDGAPDPPHPPRCGCPGCGLRRGLTLACERRYGTTYVADGMLCSACQREHYRAGL